MGGFFSALFGGSSPQLNQALSQSGQVAGFGTNLGEGDITQASNFDKALLSGDPSAIGKILSPQFSDIQAQGQQQLQNLVQFGNRSGGTNAAAETNIDSQRADVERLISQLTGQAEQGLTGIGLGEQGIGLGANQQQAGEAQQKLENEKNSIFGNVLGDLSGFGTDLLTGGIGGLFGGAGGGGFGGIGDSGSYDIGSLSESLGLPGYNSNVLG